MKYYKLMLHWFGFGLHTCFIAVITTNEYLKGKHSLHVLSTKGNYICVLTYKPPPYIVKLPGFWGLRLTEPGGLLLCFRMICQLK